jgi:hypothetical protein
MEFPSRANHFQMHHAELLRFSFLQRTGNDLLDPQLDALAFAEQLFNAPFAVLSHNTASDPLFNYANSKALELFELDWERLLVLPSRFSAEPVNRDERARLLENVTRDGYINNYQGIRISSTGRRFQISDAVVWNLVDREQNKCGQAAYFKQWLYL